MKTAAPLVWAFFGSIAVSTAASGMEFRIHYQPQMNVRMIIAEGRIQTGDAEAFLELSKSADRDGEGLVVLILNSPGGNVEAAFRFVDSMDKVGVYTAVPNNAMCASACASILFSSGERRSIFGNGVLGFHSCYRRDGRAYVNDSFCNEIVAANAMKRGVSHAGINRFAEHDGAGDMEWVDRNIACNSLKGLCKAGLLERQPESNLAMTRCLDCSKLPSISSQLVCGDEELSRLDKELTEAYGQSLRSSTNLARIRASQRAWLLHSNNKCGDTLCLRQSYRLRIGELKRPHP